MVDKSKIEEAVKLLLEGIGGRCGSGRAQGNACEDRPDV